MSEFITQEISFKACCLSASPLFLCLAHVAWHLFVTLVRISSLEEEPWKISRIALEYSFALFLRFS